MCQKCEIGHLFFVWDELSLPIIYRKAFVLYLWIV